MIRGIIRAALLHATLLLATTTTFTNAFASITPGSKIPNVDLHWGFNPVTKVNMPEYVGGQSVLIIGLPGAFTPASTNVHVPSYLENQDALKDLGIDNVVIYCVNDAAVVGVWNKQLLEAYGAPNTLVTFMGDPSGAFTESCGMELTDERIAVEKGLIGRCKPFVMYVVNNIVRAVVVNDSEDDPMGDGIMDATCATSMIESIRESSMKTV